MAKRAKQMSYEERLACHQLAEQGKTDEQIAQEMGWSMWTVRKWRRAYRKGGETGLTPRMGRPPQGALSSYPQALRDELERLRQKHPGWGPITLIEEVSQLPAMSGMVLPSRARVAAFLKEKGLVRAYERHGGVTVERPPTAQAPHEEWEMDAQGRQPVTGVGEVSIVNVVDVVSRVKTESYPQLAGRALSGADYQLVLRRAFSNYGLPQRISLDHDSAFFDNTSRSPYPSRLHLWLIGLGVEVYFIDQPPPQQHAIIERAHQTMTQQTLTGQQWSSQAALWQGLDQRRHFLNTLYPSRSLAGQAPLDAYPHARHSGRSYRPEWEAEMLDLNRIATFLAQGRWFRQTNLHGEFWLGLQRYNVGRPSAYSMQKLTFDLHTREFVAKNVATGQTRRFPPKGLSLSRLMGELDPITRFPSHQLPLPFTRKDWRHIELVHLIRGTSL